MARRRASTQWRARVGPSQRDRRRLRNSNCFWGGSAPRRARERRARFVESRLDGIKHDSSNVSAGKKRVSRPPGARTLDRATRWRRRRDSPPARPRAAARSTPSRGAPSLPRRRFAAVRGRARSAASAAFPPTMDERGDARARARDPPHPFARIASERAAERASSAHVAAAFALDRRGAPVDDGEPAARLDDPRGARASPSTRTGTSSWRRARPSRTTARSASAVPRGSSSRYARPRRSPPSSAAPRASASRASSSAREATSSSTTEDSRGSSSSTASIS